MSVKCFGKGSRPIRYITLLYAIPTSLNSKHKYMYSQNKTKEKDRYRSRERMSGKKTSQNNTLKKENDDRNDENERKTYIQIEVFCFSVVVLFFNGFSPVKHAHTCVCMWLWLCVCVCESIFRMFTYYTFASSFVQHFYFILFFLSHSLSPARFIIIIIIGVIIFFLFSFDEFMSFGVCTFFKEKKMKPTA